MEIWSFKENVISPLVNWRLKGQKGCLITLVHTEGSSPRPLGSQMAVSEAGHSIGQITGGCAEKAIIDLARECIKNCENKLVRFGEGSPYLDIKLPCGSAIDVFFNCQIKTETLQQIEEQVQDRKKFYVTFDLVSGEGKLSLQPNTDTSLNSYTRIYEPNIRLMVIGSGPIVSELVRLAQPLEYDCIVVSDDDTLSTNLGELTNQVQLVSQSQLNSGFLDDYTAVALLYHDHEKEMPVFAAFKDKACMYFGALGSKRTHEKRKAALLDLGYDEKFVNAIRGPIGMPIGSKNPVEISIAVLAQIIAHKNNP